MTTNISFDNNLYKFVIYFCIYCSMRQSYQNIKMTKVAVVTGANKGIGFGIVRGLCKRFQGIVYLTSRNEERGAKAMEKLAQEGLKPRYHRVDISTRDSVELFRDYIKKEHGGLDVLVNNAAVAFRKDATEPATVQAERTVYVNYFSLVSTCEVLFPILRNGGRVVNISSSLGHLSQIPSATLKNMLRDDNLTVPELSQLMQEYIDATKQGNQLLKWGNSSYAVSKVGVTALTKIHQRMFNDKDLKINAVHPGYVATDMSAFDGTLSIDEGAAAPLYLALDADDSIRGQFIWSDKRIVDWDGELPPETN